MKPVVPLSEKLTRPSYVSSVPADVTINESLTHHTLLPQTTRNRVPTVGTYIPLTAYISALMLTFSNKRVPGHPISAATDLALPVPATSGYRFTQRSAAMFVDRARYAPPTMGSFTCRPQALSAVLLAPTHTSARRFLLVAANSSGSFCLSSFLQRNWLCRQ